MQERSFFFDKSKNFLEIWFSTSYIVLPYKSLIKFLFEVKVSKFVPKYLAKWFLTIYALVFNQDIGISLEV